MALIPVAAFFLVIVTTCKSDPTLVALKHPFVPAEYLHNTLGVEHLTIKPYEFGYEFSDGLGMKQHRREAADSSGAVKGSYGYISPDGRIREVVYIADGNGFNADIKTNEPGLSTTGQSSANAHYSVQVPPAAVVAEGLRPFLSKNVI